MEGVGEEEEGVGEGERGGGVGVGVGARVGGAWLGLTMVGRGERVGEGSAFLEEGRTGTTRVLGSG